MLLQTRLDLVKTLIVGEVLPFIRIDAMVVQFLAPVGVTDVAKVLTADGGVVLLIGGEGGAVPASDWSGRDCRLGPGNGHS